MQNNPTAGMGMRIQAPITVPAVEWILMCAAHDRAFFDDAREVIHENHFSPTEEPYRILWRVLLRVIPEFGEVTAYNLRLAYDDILENDPAIMLSSSMIEEIMKPDPDGLLVAVADCEPAPSEIAMARDALQRFIYERGTFLPFQRHVNAAQKHGIQTMEDMRHWLEDSLQKIEKAEEIRQPATTGTSLRDRLCQNNATLEQTRGRQLIGLETGMAELDRRLLGLRGLTVLGSMPGLGKTMLCLQMGMGVARNHHVNDAIVVFFSLEMSADDLYSRMRSSLGDLDWRDFMLEDLETDTEKARDIAVRIAESDRRLEAEGLLDRMHILDRENIGDKLTATQIASKVKKLKEQAGASRALVVVDYLGLIDVEDNAGGRPMTDLQADKKRVRIVQDALKSLNAENPLGDAMIAINEARKPPNAKETWGSGLAELMGSARLGYAVDIALMYRRMNNKEIAHRYNIVESEADNYKNRLDAQGIAPVVLAIEKGRDGTSRGDIPMEFLFRRMQFRELRQTVRPMPGQRPVRPEEDEIAPESVQGGNGHLRRATAGSSPLDQEDEFGRRH